MKKKQFSEEQIIGTLPEAEAGVPVKALQRKYGFSDATFYNWRPNTKYGGLDVSAETRLKSLEAKNARLKILTVVDDFSKESIDGVVDRTIPSIRR